MHSCHRLRWWVEAWSNATSSRISMPWNWLRLTMSFSALQCNSLLRNCLQCAMSYIVVELPLKVCHCCWIVPASQYPSMFASLNCLLLYLTLHWSYACMSFNAATGCKIICFELKKIWTSWISECLTGATKWSHFALPWMLSQCLGSPLK